MFVNFRQLARLPVYTESGVKLGRIFDFELDIDSQAIARYLVRANIFSVKNFLIQVSQVKEITSDKIVVFDNVARTELNPVMSAEE